MEIKNTFFDKGVCWTKVTQNLPNFLKYIFMHISNLSLLTKLQANLPEEGVLPKIAFFPQKQPQTTDFAPWRNSFAPRAFQGV